MSDSRYSRQMLSLGKSSQTKLTNGVIRIHNLGGGLGTEVCKNLVLQGVGKLILCDTNTIVMPDIENGFYYDKYGISRVKVLRDNLVKLNPSCKIVLNDTLSEVDLDIYVNISSNYVKSKNPIIYSRAGGCRGFIFNDFKNHVIIDNDGETYNNLVIKSFSDNIVKTIEPHNFSDGDKVFLNKLVGENMDKFNKTFEIKVKSLYEFEIENDFIDYTFENGLVRKIKENIEMKFNSLKCELENPTLPEDWMNPTKPRELFDYWNTLKLNPEDKLELGPVNAYFGGLIASEAIKYLTKIYTPMNQWYFWEDTSYLNYNESGEDSIEKIVGEEVCNKIESARIFMVGSGAIGCEMLKNMSLLNMGINGKIYLTDPDTIETSNLSRQFLFHEPDVNKSKSEVAAEKVKLSNPYLNVVALKDKMCKETEHKYPKEFYGELDCLVNALDNYNARLYMDEKAVDNHLPLFESGTQGSKGNTQPVIPDLTVNYGATSDPPESESYPLCTLKNFPNKPEHVIHYIREKFNEWLNDFVVKVNKYVDDESYLEEIADVERNDLVKKMNMFFKYDSSVENQIKFWREFYYRNFRDNIMKILKSYPLDHKIEGELFWSNGKKCPIIPDNKYLLKFVKSSLGLSEMLYNKKYVVSEKDIELFIESLDEIVPDLTGKVAKDDKELKVELEENNKNELLKVKCERLNVIEFDKDVESHYEWLHLGCLVRANSYDIDFPDVLEMRKIAGKIIPAMATTTSIVAGLISLEMIKYFAEVKLDDYRSYFVNLALSQYLYSEPESCKKDEYGLTLWDKLDEREDMKVKEFIEKYEKKFGKDIKMLVSGETLIYADMMSDEEDLEKKMSEFLMEGNVLLSNYEDDEFPEISLKLN